MRAKEPLLRSTSAPHLSHAVQTELSRKRRQIRLEAIKASEKELRRKPTNATADTPAAPPVLTPDRLPDPWLFDSEKLLRELDRCREMVLLIPAPTHETHFAINNAISAIWNLREQLRYLLSLHKDGQRAFATRHKTTHTGDKTDERQKSPQPALRAPPPRRLLAK